MFSEEFKKIIWDNKEKFKKNLTGPVKLKKLQPGQTIKIPASTNKKIKDNKEKDVGGKF